MARALAGAGNDARDDARHDSRVRLVAVHSRRADVGRTLADELAGVVHVPISALAAHVDLVILAVADRDVATFAEHNAWSAGITVVHTSGSLDLTPLRAAAERGAAVGSFHPLVSFPAALVSHAAQSERFAGCVAATDGDERVLTQLRTLATALRMQAVHVGAEWRVRWHAAAAFMANASASLASLGDQMLSSLPLEAHERRAAIAGLLGSVAQNVAALPAESALRAVISGPIARGDTDTVARHLAELARSRGVENSGENVAPDSTADALVAYRYASQLVTLALQLPPSTT
jgi:predicted short-subunit dehydrogenase-like oxidoreductase (DUF2520 family)